jgi:uncharacterized protein (DUF2252 family)
MARGPTLLSLTAVVMLGCLPSPTRDAEVAQVLFRANEITARARPRLVAGQYARMSTTAYEFYRGNLPLFRHDWENGSNSRSGFSAHLKPVWGLADPHPENFGILIAGDGTPALEANDFDGADRVPYLFDLRRLVAGLGLGARLSNPEAKVSAIGAAAATAYATTLARLSAGEVGARVVSDDGSAILADLFRRSARDLAARAELTALTTIQGTERRLVRGVLDPAEPTQVFADAPPVFREAVQDILNQAFGPSPQLNVLDVVREFGAGVASWSRMRFIVLVAGPTDSLDDDVLLEVKEQTESAVVGWYSPSLETRDTPQRVAAALRRLWFRPDADPNWTTTSWKGLPLQIRTESEAHKTIRVSRWTGSRGTEAEFIKLAQQLGTLLARLHSRSEPAAVAAIASRINRDVGAFSSEQGDFAEACTTQTLSDFEGFRRSLATEGPLLGLVHDVGDGPSGAIESLFGTPP